MQTFEGSRTHVFSKTPGMHYVVCAHPSPLLLRHRLSFIVSRICCVQLWASVSCCLVSLIPSLSPTDPLTATARAGSIEPTRAGRSERVRPAASKVHGRCWRGSLQRHAAPKVCPHRCQGQGRLWCVSCLPPLSPSLLPSIPASHAT